MKISVAIATYNGEKFIQEQLESIVNQSKKIDEIIISDDGSVDSTIKICNDYLSKLPVEYKILRNSSSIGVQGNFFKAILECKGDIIFTSDQDDVWKYNKVEMLSKQLIEENALLIFSDATLVDENMEALNVNVWSSFGINFDSIDKQEIFKNLLRNSMVTGATMAFTSDLINLSLPYSKFWLHDEWLAFIAAYHNKITFCKEELIYYRQHSNNVIGANKKSLFSRIINYTKQLNKFNSFVSEVQLKEKKLNDLLNAVDFHNSQPNNDHLMECVYFWQMKRSLSPNKKIESLRLVLKLYRNGLYSDYQSGIASVITDCYYIFIKRRSE